MYFIYKVTLTVVYEIAPEKFKESYMSFCMTLLWVLAFISTKYLPQFLDLLGFDKSMYFFAGVCILTAIYVILYMPETKPAVDTLASKSSGPNT